MTETERLHVLDTPEIRNRIRAYCTEEVTRQGHNVEVQEGQDRVRWMLEAWHYGFSQASGIGLVTVETIKNLGKMIEPEKNLGGIRRCAVMIAGEIRAQPYHEIVTDLDKLCGKQKKLPPMQWYLQFEKIHPFADGNGRTGKVLLNWLNGTMLDPIFPPNDLFGRPIRNP